MCKTPDLGQMFTPPKSKSPFEAATSGSSGGWAKDFSPSTGKYAWANKLGTAALGLIPYVGPFLAAGAGAAGSLGGNTGYQGSDYGSKNWWPTISGAGSGYMMGKTAKGIANWAGGGGFQNAANSIKGWGGGTAGAGAGAGAGVTGFGGGRGGNMYGGGRTGGPSFSILPGGGSPSPMKPGPTYPGQTLDINTGLPVNTTMPSTGGNWWDQYLGGGKGKAVAGVATSLLGSAFRGPSEMPKSPYADTYAERLLGGSEMSKLAEKELMGGMGRPEPTFQENDKIYEAAVRKNKEEEARAEEALRVEYKGVRPGADIATDSGFRRDVMRMRERFRNERMSMRDELAYRRELEFNRRQENYYNQKLSYLSTSLNMNQQQIQDYAQLAQMDTERLMAQFGLEKGEAARFQELFGDIGKLFLQQGLGNKEGQ